jgi:hypothetical protein
MHSASASDQLELLAPQRTLERGYAILADESGRVLRQPSEIQPPQRLKLTLAGGSTLVDIAARATLKIEQNRGIFSPSHEKLPLRLYFARIYKGFN